MKNTYLPGKLTVVRLINSTPLFVKSEGLQPRSHSLPLVNPILLL